MTRAICVTMRIEMPIVQSGCLPHDSGSIATYGNVRRELAKLLIDR